MSEDLIIRGSLEESSFPELLRSLRKSKESGVLSCFVGDFLKSIYIQEGQILFAHSTNLDERLGESLLRTGKITIRQFLDASGLVRPGKRLGAVLCEMRVLSPEDLVDGVRKQVQDIILSLFQEKAGTYELALKDIDTQEMIVLNMSTEDIIFNGIKSIGSWVQVNKGIGGVSARVYPSEDAGKYLMNMTLTSEELLVFSLAERGKCTVEEICTMSYFTNFETCRLLWGFLMIGALESTEAVKVETGVPAIYTTSMDSEYELHDLVEDYSDLYAHIYDSTFDKVGEQADVLAEQAMHRVREAMPNIATDLRLDTYGRLDFDSVLKNLATIPESGRMELMSGLLEEIVYALLHVVGANFGQDEQRRLTNEIKALRKRTK